MKEEIVKDLIARLMDERDLSLQQAFDAIYTSRLFEKLSDPKTKEVFVWPHGHMKNLLYGGWA